VEYKDCFVCLVLGCRDLPKMDLIGTSDPYVVLELLPFSVYHKPEKEYQTAVQKRTLDPVYNTLFEW
jgi:Ca2+-dependent lipid-binding protein